MTCTALGLDWGSRNAIISAAAALCSSDSPPCFSKKASLYCARLLPASSCCTSDSINWEEAQKGRFGPGGYLGVTSVPLPAQQRPTEAPVADRAEVRAERRRREDAVQVGSSLIIS